ncbi:MAG: malate dehydrogenase [Nitrospirae bacterium]|nr:malate dehydrogenase [Nitrospirota bacterium]
MKISVIGSGNVGATAALFMAVKELAKIVLVDVVEGLPQGKALDMMQASPLSRFDNVIMGSNDYGDTAGSELVVITAGLARKPGMSRLDLLRKNATIVRSVVEEVVKYSPQAKIVMVTNPLDVMTYLAFKVSGFKREKVLGMGGVLDSSRFRYFLAEEMKVPVRETSALVIGMHSELMLPLPEHCTVSGKPIPEIISREQIDNLINRTRKAGAEIVGFLKTGSAYVAPAASIAEMAEIIVRDKKEILPASVYLQGEYGLEGICIGVPVRLGKEGVEEIIPLDLNSEEKATLHKAEAEIKEALKNLGI